MASIETSLQLYDGASSVLSNIANAVSRTTQRFDDMNDHFENAFDDNGFNNAKNGFNTINIFINKIEKNIDNSTNSQQAFTQQVNKSMEAEEQMLSHVKSIDNAVNGLNSGVKQTETQVAKTTEGFKGWQKAIIVANQAIGLIKNTLGSLGVMDMSGAFSRIDTMNRFQKTVTVMTGDANLAKAALAELKDTVVGTAYGLDVASKSAQGFMTRGMSLGAATSQVRVWADAVSFYGEGTNAQLESVVDAIGKMYSKGKVEADQLDRLFDAGIGAAEIYADAVGQSASKVKDDLSKGTISASQFINTVSKALDSGISAGAAKEAGNTWATTFANVHAAITRGWASVITDLDAALASHGLPSAMEMVTAFGQKVEAILNKVGDSMNTIIGVAMNIYDVMGTVGGFVVDNWSIIAPIIYAVAAALALYTAVLITNNAVQAISNGLKAVAALKAGVLATAQAYAAGATFAEMVAVQGLNTALLACPLTWIILLIIALIAIFYIVIAVINRFAGTSLSATGIIAGAFLWLMALIGNICIGTLNAIIQALWSIFVEPFLDIIEWVLNVANGGFDSFGGAVANLIGQIISWFLSLGKVVTKIIDAIFGTNWTAGLSSLQDSVIEWGKNENAITLDRSAPGIDYRFDMTDAFDKGYEWGSELTDSFKNLLKSEKDNEPHDFNTSKAYENLAETADNTGKLADSVNISDEDLKYFHDIAEREAINRYTTREVKIDMTNYNTVSSDRDLDGVVNYLREALEKDMSISAEGA